MLSYIVQRILHSQFNDSTCTTLPARTPNLFARLGSRYKIGSIEDGSARHQASTQHTQVLLSDFCLKQSPKSSRHERFFLACCLQLGMAGLRNYSFGPLQGNSNH